MRILSCIAVCVVASSLFAQEAPEVLKNLEAVVQAELAKNPHAAIERGEGETAGAQSILLQLRSAVRTGTEATQIDALLDQLTIIFPTEPVKQAAVKAADQMRKDREQKQKARVAEIDVAIQAAVDALHKASEPADLDRAIEQLRRYRMSSANAPPAERSGIERAEAGLRFLQEWQTFMMAEKSGNTEAARDALNNILASPKIAGLMPRSELVARSQKYSTKPGAKPEETDLEQIDRIVTQAKTLDDIPAVIRELTVLRGRIRPPMSSGSEPVNSTLNTLISMERTYREFQAGLPTRFEIISLRPNDATSASVTPLKAQLLMLIIPRYLDLPADLTTKPNETVNQFIDRIMDEAIRRGDPGLLARTRDLQRSLVTGTFYLDTNTGSNAFVAGQNQEKAGQFMPAVISYQNALRSGGDAMPVKLIGERLHALKSEHPQEYEEGMRIFLAPPRWDGSPLLPSASASPVRTMPIPAKAPSASPATLAQPSPTPATSTNSKTP